MPFAHPKGSFSGSSQVATYRGKAEANPRSAAIVSAHRFTEYKLNAAWHELQRFKSLLTEAGGGFTTSPGAEQGARFELQVALDSVLHELSGVPDALLQEISAALDLPLAPDEVNTGAVMYHAKAKSADAVVKPVLAALDEGKWLWEIREHHNQTEHRNTVSVDVDEYPVSGGVTPEGQERLHFARATPGGRPASRKEVLAYLESAYGNLIRMAESVYAQLVHHI